jgi:peptide/nickel transport system ATP-binding protein
LQRAMAAMALACRPDVLVLDEPTTALDVTTQIELLAHLKHLIRQYGTAALYISHDLALVAQIADRIMVLRRGRVVESGTAREVLEAPRTEYARALLAERKAEAAPAGPLQLENVLVVDDVSVRFGSNEVLRAAGLTVARGETVAVVGESGSGKTTLASVICGKTAPHTGTVSLDGVQLAPHFSQRNREQLRRIQLIFQLPEMALNPAQTVEQIVARPLEFYFRRGRIQARAEAKDLLSAVGLDPILAERFPGQLSGGQRQRVCIARALAAQPDVIVCDEITAALDPLVAEEILKLLQRLQRERSLSFVFITHDLVTVRRIAHRVVVMLQGSVVARGKVETVFSSDHPYVERLVAATPEPRIGWLDEVLRSRTLLQSPP